MKDLDLPEPITAYFQADTQGGDAVARCFTSDGHVLDEHATHTGPAAIAVWKDAADARYAYTASPHTLEKQGGTYRVTARVAGNFPGSPADLRYNFTLERGKIATLEIGS